jgi:pimeloyl-ACP methyl ester carboxylesterase
MSDARPSIAVQLNGTDFHYVDAGEGPAVALIHGLLGSHANWDQVVDSLAVDHRVVAPDLLGHGSSSKAMGDYSLSAHAAILRDLFDHLGISSATIVGHSLGGGIALQFAYLFPDRVDRLVLVSSGGLGRELSPLLRAATLPGAELVVPLLASRWVSGHGAALGRGLTKAGIRSWPDVTEIWRGLSSLNDRESRRAFFATTRAVIDPGGQTVNASPRLHLAATVPTLLVWGARDRMIPSWHADRAQKAIKGSRVEVFERAGHFPHLDEPERFARVLRAFIATSDPEPATVETAVSATQREQR